MQNETYKSKGSYGDGRCSACHFRPLGELIQPSVDITVRNLVDDRPSAEQGVFRRDVKTKSTHRPLTSTFERCHLVWSLVSIAPQGNIAIDTG